MDESKAGPGVARQEGDAAAGTLRRAALRQFVRGLGKARDLTSVCATAVDTLVSGIDNRGVAIVRREEAGFRVLASRGVSAAYVEALERGVVAFPASPNQEPQLIQGLPEHPTLAPVRSILLDQGFVSCLSVTLTEDGKDQGRCLLFRDVAWQADTSEIQFAELLAEHVAAAMQRQRLEDRHAGLRSLARRVIEASPHLVSVKDLQGRYLIFNAKAVEMTGLAEKDVMGRTDAELFPVAMAAHARELDDIVCRTGTGPTYEQPFIRPDGTSRLLHTTKSPFFDHAGRIAGVLSITVDRTAQIEADEQRLRAEAMFSALVQQSRDFFLIVGSDGVTWASAAFFRLLGWAEADVVGRPLAAFAHPDDAERVRGLVSAAERNADVTRLIELRLLRADGGSLPVELLASDQRFDPVIAGVLISGRDVSERLQEAERRRRADRMESVGRLAGGIAHDFNNLLMVVTANVDVLLNEPHLDAQRDMLMEIGTAATSAASLTRQLLRFSSGRADPAGDCDLADVVESMRSLLTRSCGARVALQVEAQPVTVRVNRAACEQLVMNLVLNARDAVGGDGVVGLRIGPVDTGWAELVVSDDGQGMDVETRAHAFDPFYTTKAVGKGTGLGLATVHRVVTDAGGTIDLSSEPGRGTTVSIRLPASAGIVREAPSPLPAQAAPAQGETILLVDDEALVRGMIRRLLVKRGYTVIEAASGDEAVACFGEHADAVALLLTDVTMPGMDGWELSQQLLALKPGLPVLYMSGYNAVPTLQSADERGDLLPKPIKPADLARAVRAALDQRT